MYRATKIFKAYDYKTGVVNLVGIGQELKEDSTIPNDERSRVLDSWVHNHPDKQGSGYILFSVNNDLLWVGVRDFVDCLEEIS